jgi:two-component system CheB/CheR fusion protein
VSQIAGPHGGTELRTHRLPGGLEEIRDALDKAAIVATTDVRGAITYVNNKFCEISQYSREELIGRNHRLINSGYHPEEFFREMYRTIAGGHIWRAEIRNRARDGSFYWVDTTIVPFLDERGRPYQYVAIRYDVTERKKTERALRDQAALVTMGKLASVVAHEVRNPLAGIRGAMQVIGKRLPADSSDRAIVQQVIERIDGLNGIVEDLLIFARPRPVTVAPMALGALIEQTAQLIRQDPRFAGVAIEVDADDATLMGDAEQITQVLLNLLMNAAQAMQGQGVIHLSARCSVGRCELSVRDHGPGISEAVRAHLFEPFFTTKSRGTGLGLATAQRVVESHGGTLTIENVPEGGTLARVCLPLDGS